MAERSIQVTREAMASLADKLDELAEGLSDEERGLLAAVVAAGAQSLTAEVEGFGGIPGSPLSMNFASPGAPLRLEFDGVVIKQIQEVTGLKFEQDVIE